MVLFIFTVSAILIIAIRNRVKAYKKYASEKPKDRYWTQILKSPEGEILAERECEELWWLAGWFRGPIDEAYLKRSAATSWVSRDGVYLSQSDVSSYVKAKRVEGYDNLITKKQ
jgi:hypothetical protein